MKIYVVKRNKISPGFPVSQPNSQEARFAYDRIPFDDGGLEYRSQWQKNKKWLGLAWPVSSLEAVQVSRSQMA
jgi:hypothetical protein